MRKCFWRIGVFSLLAGASACLTSDEDLEGHKFRCDTSEQCGAGWQCNQVDRFCIQAYQDANGVFDDRIRLGMAGPIDQAPTVPGAEAIGQQVRDGLLAYFAHVNRTGGIHGRRLELRVGDDNYLPDVTEEIVTDMLGGANRDVFALLTVLGTAPSLRAMEVAKSSKALLFAPGSGADRLEPPSPERYVFNFRPRYSDEIEQLIDYLVNKAEPRVSCGNIALFAFRSKDGSLGPIGESGVNGAATALRTLCDIPKSDLVLDTFEEDTIEVDAAAGTFLRWMAEADRAVSPEPDGSVVVALAMLPAFDSGAIMVKRITDAIAAVKRNDGRNTMTVMEDGQQKIVPVINARHGSFSSTETERLEKIVPRFAASSNAGLAMVDALAFLGSYQTKEGGRLVEKLYGAGTIFAMPVPPVTAGTSGVAAYNQHLTEYIQDLPEEQGSRVIPSAFSLEAYLVGALFGEALRAHGRDITTGSFIDTLETLEGVKLGVGPSFGFSNLSHQAQDKLWGLELDDEFNLIDLGLLTGE